MSVVPTTPRGQTSFNPTTPLSSPTASRIANAQLGQSSPHYGTTRRHSLYGIEDRVIIDPGSHIWKVGFSGEGRPRDVFCASGKSGVALWNLSRAADVAEREEEGKLLEVILQKCLRSIFHKSLLADPKSRKVIIVEHPLLPIYIKEMIARILFDNLQVPSISFASSHLLSLFAVGRITGLVLDCGHLESAALPIFSARPLFPQLRTTPLAGARLTSHLRALLLMFGTYLPPPTSLSASANIPAATRSMRVPLEILTDTLVEEIKTRCCLVSEGLDYSGDVIGDDLMELDLPPTSDTSRSESEFSHRSGGLDSNRSSYQDSSEFSVVSSARTPYIDRGKGGNQMQALAALYTRHSTATDIHMRVIPPPSQQAGTGRGTLIIPGWVRERAAEVLFEGGDVDENSVAEVILEALLKVPMDLRKKLASSIVVVGGSSMLPGFIPRLQAELLQAVIPTASPSRPPMRPGRPVPPPYDRYAPLRPLVPHIAILNNPSPRAPIATTNAGKAPAFSPATIAWVGGSLAGALKTGGVEVAREKWDEACSREDPDDSMDDSAEGSVRSAASILPDWTRLPLLPASLPMVQLPRGSPQAQVGA